MKKLLSILCIAGMLPLSTGTASAATLLRGRCDTLRGLARGRCESRMDTRIETDALNWRNQNSSAVRDRKTAERLELQNKDRGISANRSDERNREVGKQNLQTRRETTRSSRQMRLEERKERRTQQQDERNNLLRNRVMENKANAVLNKEDLRSQTRRLREEAQDRREEIKDAHEACASLGVAERIQCMQKEREDIGN